MNGWRPSRREFVATVCALPLAAPQPATGGRGWRRTLMDPCNLLPLAGIRLRVEIPETGKALRLRCDQRGSFDLGAAAAALPGGAGVMRIRIAPTKVGGFEYAGLDYRMRILAGAPTGVLGNLALLPLSGAGRGSGIGDGDFEAAWRALLEETAFAAERSEDFQEGDYRRGAVCRWARRCVDLRLGASLSAAEMELAAGKIEDGVTKLTAAMMAVRAVTPLPADREPFFVEDLPVGTLTVIKRASYPRPAVRLRFAAADPHEITAALIVLDDYTLNENFRGGGAGAEQVALAGHLVQRAAAEALGYRPTMALPNRTLLDTSFDPVGWAQRQGICAEDIILARALYGSRCLAPGTRWTAAGDTLATDPSLPQE